LQTIKFSLFAVIYFLIFGFNLTAGDDKKCDEHWFPSNIEHDPNIDIKELISRYEKACNKFRQKDEEKKSKSGFEPGSSSIKGWEWMSLEAGNENYPCDVVTLFPRSDSVKKVSATSEKNPYALTPSKILALSQANNFSKLELMDQLNEENSKTDWQFHKKNMMHIIENITDQILVKSAKYVLKRISDYQSNKTLKPPLGNLSKDLNFPFENMDIFLMPSGDIIILNNKNHKKHNNEIIDFGRAYIFSQDTV
jgi:hypothetical protein